MNFGVWGVQVFITYFFISYIYYVLYIKRVYENHMIMCDGYMMLTFFISMRLVNRNNCLASKQASSGLEEGMEVITTGNVNLAHEAPVRVIKN